MVKKRRFEGMALQVAALGLGGALAFVGSGQAADHVEAPGTQADVAADIGDFFAWHVPGQNKLVTILTFDGLKAPGGGGTFDDDVIYTVHIDNDGDNISDIQIHTRFGQDSLGMWGMQVENLPGSPAFVIGPVESINYAEGGRYVFAGVRDDPFFFDLDGYGATLSTGDLSFDNTRDSFAGTNITAIVLEMDLNEALGGGTTLQAWATTGRRTL